MLCPKCANDKTFVIKTLKGLKNIRMRRCSECGYSWMTEEKPLKDQELIEYAEYIEQIEDKK
ncbi:hypothetical protein [Campylobacter hyointestinalis]|uniref:hypothetical protein n=1 Tax=Campylobacter hyointestinalis TaxID=198 RepID=UPI000725111C|nr:hypothetical protein [Campylobacter hyointestinalis]CUU82170.1 transcriptional repressor NrdR [Campylobacter hyointestinalis subsp. hyointestinalis]